MTERRTARRYDLSLPVIVRTPTERGAACTLSWIRTWRQDRNWILRLLYPPRSLTVRTCLFVRLGKWCEWKTRRKRGQAGSASRR